MLGLLPRQTLSSILMSLLVGLVGFLILIYIQVSAVFATYLLGLLPHHTLSSILMSLLVGLVVS